MSSVKNDLPIKELQAVADTVSEAARVIAFSTKASVCYIRAGLLVSEHADGSQDTFGSTPKMWTKPTKRRWKITIA